MINNICAFQERNEMLVETLKTLFEKEPARRVLLLSDRRSHLDKLHMMLKEIAISSVKYYGGVKQEVLAQDVQVILATFAIASEGYDQQGLNTLVLASPKSDIIQSIGRILRERAEERTIEPLVIDIADDFSLFARQASKRQQFYKSNGYNISNI
jgi:superfamily II DNA or RNA helicase